MRWILEGFKDLCVYRGELLGLLAIHLILLAVNKKVRIASDCLGALGQQVVDLSADRLPSRVKHSNILKVLMMLHCQAFTFDCIYDYVEAHQDNHDVYYYLPRPAQLNFCMDLDIKSELWELVGQLALPQQPLPMEPVVVMIGFYNMTSGSEDTIVYWCNKILARRGALSDPKVHWIDEEQFDEVHWSTCYQALTEAPRMFQIFASKKTMSIAARNVTQAYYTPGHNKMCPSCGVVQETCAHGLTCQEAGRVDVLHRSIDHLDKWLKDNGTNLVLMRFLVSMLIEEEARLCRK